MHFEPDHIYHVYNRGNNKTRIFFNDSNYLFLLNKIRQEWLPYCDLLCYTLMPNHFHLVLQPNEQGCESIMIKETPSHLQVLSKAIGKTLSSYTQAINNQNKTTGSLFQKKTKAKCLTDESVCLDGLGPGDYLVNCFRYVHNNPVAAMLVDDPRKWRWSSWHEYFGAGEEGLCNMELATRVLGMEALQLRGNEGLPLDARAISGIW